MAENGFSKDQVKELTDRLEAGLKDLFTSDKYLSYLKTMSSFTSYSTRNTLLIHMQMPSATRVAGYAMWQSKFERHVKRGEKGIRIYAPMSSKEKVEKQKLDPDTKIPLYTADGKPIIEEVEHSIPRFKLIPVFDVSQTDGKPLPQLAEDLTGDVRQYKAFMVALEAVSPLPIRVEPLSPNTDGLCRYGDCIIVREGMSEVQTVSAAIHEIAHAVCHDKNLQQESNGSEKAAPKDKATLETEAESISYVVCQRYGIETSANSFGYLASWGSGREMSELKASLDTIRKAAGELIDKIDSRFMAVCKERGIDLAIETPEPQTPDTAEQVSHEQPAASMSDKETSVTQNAPTDEEIAARIEARLLASYESTGAAAVDGVPGAFINSEQELAIMRLHQWQQGGVGRELYMENERMSLRDEQQPTPPQVASAPEASAPEKPGLASNQHIENIDGVEFVFTGVKPAVQQAKPANPPQRENTNAHRIFHALMEIAPEVIVGKYEYMRLQAGEGFMPLTFERLSGDRFALMHYHMLNGDMMRDPDMELIIDRQNHTVNAMSFTQHPYIYQEVRDGQAGLRLQRELNSFLAQWVSNIKQQAYTPEKARLPEDRDLIDTTVYFNSERQPFNLAYVHDSAGITAFNRLDSDGVYGMKEIAHISVERTVTFTADDLPPAIISMIEEKSQSDEIVFTSAPDNNLPDTPIEPEFNGVLPDPAIGFSERDLFGYIDKTMLPLTADRALELFDKDHTIYLLYSDNTEAMAFDRVEIETHDGIFGIERGEWETSREFQEMSAAADNNEAPREADLIFGNENSYGIYQLKSGDTARDFRFESYVNLELRGLSVDRANYELVYTARLDIRDTQTNLHNIFKTFNDDNERPADFTGHSVSVSDVIVLQWRGEVSSHYVDSFGFKELSSFLGHERQPVQAQTTETPPVAENPAAPSVAELESTVKAGQSISVLDLAHAVKNEQKPPIKQADSAKKPSILARLEAEKKRAVNSNGLEQPKTAPKRDNDKEVH